MVTYGRKRHPARPHAMPFHSVATEEEAEQLIILHCRLGYQGNFHFVEPTWPNQDIETAIAVARRRFRVDHLYVPPKEASPIMAKTDREAAPRKPRTKAIPFSNTATEVHNGVWQWICGGITWRYRTGAGLNAGPVQDNEWQPQLFFKSLNEAACFAEGFNAGLNQKRGES